MYLTPEARPFSSSLTDEVSNYQVPDSIFPLIMQFASILCLGCSTNWQRHDWGCKQREAHDRREHTNDEVRDKQKISPSHTALLKHNCRFGYPDPHMLSIYKVHPFHCRMTLLDPGTRRSLWGYIALNNLPEANLCTIWFGCSYGERFN